MPTLSKPKYCQPYGDLRVSNDGLHYTKLLNGLWAYKSFTKSGEFFKRNYIGQRYVLDVNGILKIVRHPVF
jgi:hypothetical protein